MLCDLEAVGPEADLVRLNFLLAVRLALLDDAGIADLAGLCGKKRKRTKRTSEGRRQNETTNRRPRRTGEKATAGTSTHQGRRSRSSCLTCRVSGLTKPLAQLRPPQGLQALRLASEQSAKGGRRRRREGRRTSVGRASNWARGSIGSSPQSSRKAGKATKQLRYALVRPATTR